ncbi:MAG TPA: shikimate dehydrogenase [Gemmatimonadaceae bacterium]
MTIPGRLVLLGHPVRHSLSPRFQNAALRAAGIPLTYEALDVLPDALGNVLGQLRAENAAGNVTVPHKAAVAAACDRHTGTAIRTGAVNTFWCDGNRLVGDNTDVAGFRALAVSVLGQEPVDAVVGLLGAGGGAAAVCAVVEEWPGARVVVHARGRERAVALAHRFPGLVGLAYSTADAIRDATIVVNATPVGLQGDDVPVAVSLLPRDAAVMDLAYRAGQTPWILAAREAGHRAADGLEMLIAQGAEAFERWFGRAPDRNVMRQALAA